MLLCNIQQFSKLLKLIFWRSFGEDVHSLIFGLEIFELNVIIFQSLSNKVMLDGNMFCTNMADKSFCHSNGRFHTKLE